MHLDWDFSLGEGRGLRGWPLSLSLFYIGSSVYCGVHNVNSTAHDGWNTLPPVKACFFRNGQVTRFYLCSDGW